VTSFALQAIVAMMTIQETCLFKLKKQEPLRAYPVTGIMQLLLPAASSMAPTRRGYVFRTESMIGSAKSIPNLAWPCEEFANIFCRPIFLIHQAARIAAPLGCLET